MKLWRVVGADIDTGVQRIFEVEAPNEDLARVEAQTRRVAVERVSEVRPPAVPVPEATRDTAQDRRFDEAERQAAAANAGGVMGFLEWTRRERDKARDGRSALFASSRGMERVVVYPEGFTWVVTIAVGMVMGFLLCMLCAPIVLALAWAIWTSGAER